MRLKRALRSIFLCGWMEYRQWLRNPRMVLLAVFFVYMYTTVLEPIIKYAEEIPAQIGWFEPFVAVCNNGLMVLLFPLVFLVLMADFPKIEADTAFQIFRVGRGKWVLGQVLMLTLAAGSVIGIMFVLCALLSVGMGAQVTFQWSEAIQANISNSIIQTGDLVGLLPSNLFYQMTLSQAVRWSFGLTLLCCIALGLVMLAVAICGMRTAGMVLGAGSMITGYVLLNAGVAAKWWLPTAHYVLKAHFTAYFSQPNIPIAGSVLYFAGISLASLLVAGRKIRSYHFLTSQEVSQ